MLRYLFKKNQDCFHLKITPDVFAGYCPDCGQYIENHWFITRCGCCGIKQRTKIANGEITAETNFCKNCGNNSFVVEKLSKINFIDINYAIVIKHIVKNVKQSFVQTWVDREIVPIKLIPQQSP